MVGCHECGVAIRAAPINEYEFNKMIDWIAWITGKDPSQVCREWHSWWIGWAEAICLFIPSRFSVTEFAQEEMAEEFHYHELGRALGVLTWLLILVGIFL